MKKDDGPLFPQDPLELLRELHLIVNLDNRGLHGCLGYARMEVKAVTVATFLFTQKHKWAWKRWTPAQIDDRLGYAVGYATTGICQLRDALEMACGCCVTVDYNYKSLRNRGYEILTCIPIDVIQPPDPPFTICPNCITAR